MQMTLHPFTQEIERQKKQGFAQQLQAEVGDFYLEISLKRFHGVHGLPPETNKLKIALNNFVYRERCELDDKPYASDGIPYKEFRNLQPTLYLPFRQTTLDLARILGRDGDAQVAEYFFHGSDDCDRPTTWGYRIPHRQKPLTLEEAIKKFRCGEFLYTAPTGQVLRFIASEKTTGKMQVIFPFNLIEELDINKIQRTAEYLDEKKKRN